jgi:hypothetical protein
MSWMQERQAKGRAKLEAKVSPALALLRDRGEAVQVQGFGIIMPTWPYFLIGAGAAFMMRQYWIAVTDRSLLLIRIPSMTGNVSIEVTLPRSEVRVTRDQAGALARYVTLEAHGKKYRLRFPTPYRGEGESIAAALGSL